MTQPVSGFVGVAPDGSGKSIYNFRVIIPMPDGTTPTVYAQATVLLDPLQGIPVRPMSHEQAQKISEQLETTNALLAKLVRQAGGL